MKKILFPTDFSEVATNAFEHAIEFAKIVDGELILLHSYDLPAFDEQFFYENYKMIYDSLELSQFEQFKDEIPKLRAIAEGHHLDEIRMTHRLMDGDLTSNVKKAIQEDKIDFVVMGTSGATEWEALFVGSNSGSVIIGTNVPLLCIPLGAKYNKIKTIGFRTRFKDEEKEALKTVLDIAKKTNATVKCLYVKTGRSEISKDTVEKWQNEFSGEPIEFFVVTGDAIKEIVLDFILEKKVDLLVMLNYKKGLFANIFRPSFTDNSFPDFDIPILELPVR
jgi:nucleotide-binding universal stress UspA family protein